MAARTTRAKAQKRELVSKQYRLIDMSPLTYTVKVGRDKNLVIYDEASGMNRAIRHCKNEKSIFVDEQSESAVVEPIIFLRGLLDTKPTDTITQDFLDAHPKYGIKFSVIDDAADAKEHTDFEELKIDVKSAIRKKAKEETGEEELRLIVSALISDVVEAANMSMSQIKNTLYDLVDTNIYRFVDEDTDEITIFDDADIQRKALAMHAFNSSKIRVSADNKKILWVDNKATICNIPLGKDHLEYFADFLGTEEGLKVAGEIAKR